MKIRVDGMGLFCSLGSTPDEVYQRMCAGEHAFRPIWRFSAEASMQKNAGQISSVAEDSLRERFPEQDLAGALALDAAQQALNQANIPSGTVDSRLGLVLATNFGPLEAQEWLWREKMDIGKVSAESSALVDDFLPSVAKIIGCGGPCVQLSMSCASAPTARILRSSPSGIPRAGPGTRPRTSSG